MVCIAAHSVVRNRLNPGPLESLNPLLQRIWRRPIFLKSYSNHHRHVNLVRIVAQNKRMLDTPHHVSYIFSNNT